MFIKKAIAFFCDGLTATRKFRSFDGPPIRPHPRDSGLADITKVPGCTRGETTSLFTAGRALDI